MLSPASSPAPHGLSVALRIGQSMNIGNEIVVWVTEARAGTARLVIAAPADLTITRQPRTATPD